MSYSFDGANDFLSGSFTTAINEPLTIALWFKVTTHPVATRQLIQFGVNSGTQPESYGIKTVGVDDRWAGEARDTADAVSQSLVDVNRDTLWTPALYIVTSETDRVLNLNGTDSSVSTTSRVVGACVNIRVGEALNATNDFAGLIAELAIWDTALDVTQRASVVAGNSAALIAESNLRGYWPLSSSNATQSNEGLDATGDLSVTGATFDADHPSITMATPPTLYLNVSPMRLR